ncbi:MAG: hypothetical protein MHPSP_002546, partial [Paramarteilia canceri]
MVKRHSKIEIIRKFPIPGYDVSFLLTDSFVLNHNMEEIITLMKNFVIATPAQITSQKNYM